MYITIGESNIQKYLAKVYPSVTRLEWGNCPFDPIVLASFPNLQTLDCSRIRIPRNVGRYFAQPKIYTLDWLHYCPQLLELRCCKQELESLKGIEFCLNLETLRCFGCNISTLAGIENCKKLYLLFCSSNKLTNISEIQDCKVLRNLDCGFNQLTTLDVGSCPLLKNIDCGHNRLTVLQGIENCTGLWYVGCSSNRLTSLEWLRSLTQLRHLECEWNRLTSIDGIEGCYQLQIFRCNNNLIRSLAHLVYLRKLRSVRYSDNPISIQTTQVQRWLLRIDRARTDSSIYSNGQNVHDITIQKSVCVSIKSLMTDSKPTFSIAMIVESGMDERAIRLLLEYCSDEAVHSVHLLTYLELLSYVWARIDRSEHRAELIKILGEQISDSECKCFTGRFNRTLSVLVGFYDDIVIEISDTARIGAIIIAVKERLELYDPEVHQDLARIALLEAGYDAATIEPWLDAILEN